MTRSNGLEIVSVLYSARTCTAREREGVLDRLKEWGPGKASIFAYQTLPLGFQVFVLEHKNERGQRVAATAIVVKPEND